MPAEEKLIRVTAFIYRKPGMSSEEFHHYWSEIHGPKMVDLSKRYGVVEYRQYHTTPETKELLNAVTKGTGKECMAFDGTAETLVRDLQQYLKMNADPEYLEKMVPDENAFMDRSRLEFTIGYEYGIISNGKYVTDHVRKY